MSEFEPGRDVATDEWTQPFGKLAGALAKAQAAYPAIPRDRTVTIRPRDKTPYSFSYAPLDTILNAVRGPLASNGLAITQILDGSNLVTLLLHESGEFLRSSLPVPRGEGMQEFGAKITYLRRYALQSLLGVAAEDDNDAELEPGAPAGPSPTLAAAVQTRKPKTAADGRAEGQALAAQAQRPTLVSVPAAPATPPPAVAPTPPPAAPEAPEPTEAEEPVEDAGEESEPEADDPVEAAVLATKGEGATGLTMDEFRQMSREKHYLTGFVTGVAKEVFKDRQPAFTLVQDLTDDERFLLWLALAANS